MRGKKLTKMKVQNEHPYSMSFFIKYIAALYGSYLFSFQINQAYYFDLFYKNKSFLNKNNYLLLVLLFLFLYAFIPFSPFFVFFPRF
jgi:hypothetical protein